MAKPIAARSSSAPHGPAQGDSQSAVCQADLLAGREAVTLGIKNFSLDMGVVKDQSGYGFAIARSRLLHLPEHRSTEPLEMAWGAPPDLQKDRGLPGSSDVSASPLGCFRCPLVLGRCSGT